MNSSNPIFNTKAYKDKVYDATVIGLGQEMTLAGTLNKTFIMFLLLTMSAMVTWWMAFNGYNIMVLTIGGAIVGFVLVLISVFKPEASGYLAPGYAIFEGLFLGGVSAIFEAMYPGIVTQAVACTFVTFVVCLGLYRYKIVKVTEKFRFIVIAATLAIATYYLLSWILSMFMNFTPIHHGNSMMSIGVSVFVIIIAALNLFLDFDLIEKGVESKMPKYMEWFGAMALMITLVWLYIEFLRLLSKLNSRN